MRDVASRSVKTGGGPRIFPDFTSPCDEMNKLTHSARPDVDWRHWMIFWINGYCTPLTASLAVRGVQFALPARKQPS